MITDEMISLLGCSKENIKFIIKYLGFEINKKKQSALSGDLDKNDKSHEKSEIKYWYTKKYNHHKQKQKKSRLINLMVL